MKRNNANYNEKIIDNILFKYANKENSYSFITYLNNKISAITFCLKSHNKVYYLLGGYDSKNNHSSSGPIAVWESIKHAKKLNLTGFDLKDLC